MIQRQPLLQRLILTICFLGVANIAFCAQQLKPLDSIVAIVNDHIVTQTELDRAIDLARASLQAQNLPAPSKKALHKQILNQLIDTELQVEMANNLALKVHDQEIAQTIQNILKTNHINQAQLKQSLAKENISYENYKENIKKQLLIHKLQKSQVGDNITLDQQAVQKTVNTIRNHTQSMFEYNIQHILIPLSETPTSQEVRKAKQLSNQIITDIKNGASFKAMAIKHSSAPDAMTGGDWGWRKSMSLPKVFVAQLEKMKAGEVSAPIRTSNGFHIIKYVKKNELTTHHYINEVHLRHILMLTPNKASKEIVLRKINQIRDRLTMGGNFSEVAMAHSEDPMSAAKGGDLGWVGPGDLPPNLLSTANQLKDGQISRPIHTDLGWHILQVEGKRKIDLSNKQQLLHAKEIVYNKQFDEAMQDWLKQLRENAYIKVI